MNYYLTLIFVLSVNLIFGQNFNNYASLSSLEESSDSNILSGKLNQYNFFVVGETHIGNSNPIWQFELFKYLHEKEKVNHFLLEYGESRGIIINQYLKSGNLKLLYRLSATKNDYIFYAKLKDYYDKQSLGNKFLVHGIDYEKEGLGIVSFSIKLILDELQSRNNEISENSKKFLEVYEESLNNEETVKATFLFLSKVSKDSTKYYKEFKNHYFSLVMMYDAIKSNVNGVKYGGKNKTELKREKRENLIYSQVRILSQEFLSEKFFCIFGTAHIPLNKPKDWDGNRIINPFVTQLNNNQGSPFKNKVFSIVALYKTTLPPWKKSYPKKNIGLFRTDLEELDEKSKENVFTLFECPLISSDGEKLRSDYYQMILVNRW